MPDIGPDPNRESSNQHQPTEEQARRPHRWFADLSRREQQQFADALRPYSRCKATASLSFDYRRDFLWLILPPRFLAVVFLIIITVPIYQYFAAQEYLWQQLHRVSVNSLPSPAHAAEIFEYRREWKTTAAMPPPPTPDYADALIHAVKWLLAIGVVFHIVAGLITLKDETRQTAFARNLLELVHDDERHKSRG